jgi:hypothetical protein
VKYFLIWCERISTRKRGDATESTAPKCENTRVTSEELRLAGRGQHKSNET